MKYIYLQLHSIIVYQKAMWANQQTLVNIPSKTITMRRYFCSVVWLSKIDLKICYLLYIMCTYNITAVRLKNTLVACKL